MEERFNTRTDVQETLAARFNTTDKQLRNNMKGKQPCALPARATTLQDKITTMRSVYQIELLPTPEQKAVLRETMDQFVIACQFVKEFALKENEFSQSRLQQQLYMKLRKNFNLGAQVAVLVIKLVADTHRYAGSLPDFGGLTCMLYDQRTCRFINEVVVSLWTIRGRKLIPYRSIESVVERLRKSVGFNERILTLIPFACEGIELCRTGDTIILNLIYSEHVLEQLALHHKTEVVLNVERNTTTGRQLPVSKATKGSNRSP